MFIEVIKEKVIINTEELRAVEIDKDNTVLVFYKERGAIFKITNPSRREALKRYRIIKAALIKETSNNAVWSPSPM